MSTMDDHALDDDELIYLIRLLTGVEDVGAKAHRWGHIEGKLRDQLAARQRLHPIERIPPRLRRLFSGMPKLPEDDLDSASLIG